jgi:hypothetical protein
METLRSSQLKKEIFEKLVGVKDKFVGENKLVEHLSISKTFNAS